MKGQITFKRLEGSWYADLPQYIEQGGTLGDCLMVSGAPEFIEYLGGVDQLTVEISTEWTDSFDAYLIKNHNASIIEDDMGESSPGWAYYNATMLSTDESKLIKTMLVGLCPVNAWVFGGSHPVNIYVKIISFS